MNAQRIKLLQKNLQHPVLIKKKENLFYLTGRFFMHGYLLVKKSGAVFFGDGLEAAPKGAGKIKFDTLNNIGRYLSPKQVLDIYSEFTYAEGEYIKRKLKRTKLKVIVAHDPVDILRTEKDLQELHNIKKSMEITGEVFKRVKRQLKGKTWTEVKLAEFIKKEGLSLGAEDISFPPIVASGAAAAVPHHVPDGKRLTAGESIILDFGFKYKGYCSDFTRTVFLKRAPSEIAAAYETVEKAQKAALGKARIGKKAASLYNLAVKTFAEKKLDKYFIHSLGHGLGLEIHELPNLSPNSYDILKENIAFTIEPGVYVPKKFGIRIEDSVVVKNGKAQKFIDVPTGLKENIIL